MPSFSYIVYRLKRRFGCQHPSNIVRADILDGDFHGGPGGDQAVEWCPRCGAYRRVFDAYGVKQRVGEWRRPGRWIAG